MKYAVFIPKLIEFDISRGNSYEYTIKLFGDEKEAMVYAAKNPNSEMIRYEEVKLGFTAV